MESAVDIAFDGADWVDKADPCSLMLKGGGGALLREKLIALKADQTVIMVTKDKLSLSMSECKIPVEIVTFGYSSTVERLERFGYCGNLRYLENGELFFTDNKNLIFDVYPSGCEKNLTNHHSEMKQLAGVVETGIFVNVATKVIVGYPDGSVEVICRG